MSNQQFIKFNSIGQFRDVIKVVQQSAKHNQVPLPKITFTGTVKLHGTNAAIVGNRKGEWWCQSRERIISPGDDNAGFAAWAHGNKEYWDRIMKDFGAATDREGYVQIYGEWCGGNIQQGVGLNKLPKMFVIFAIRFSKDAEGSEWHDIDPWKYVFSDSCKPEQMHFITDFPTYKVEVDFESPTLVQNDLVDLTLKIEKQCPVAKAFLPDESSELVGEGLVWNTSESECEKFSSSPLFTTVRSLKFKTKGEKHSASKVKVIVPVDAEKVKSIDAFIEYAVTPNRLEQGLSFFEEMGLELSVKNTGEYIKWVMQDILKEELDTMIASGIEPKDINSTVARKAREFFMTKI